MFTCLIGKARKNFIRPLKRLLVPFVFLYFSVTLSLWENFLIFSMNALYGPDYKQMQCYTMYPNTGN